MARARDPHFISKTAIMSAAQGGTENMRGFESWEIGSSAYLDYLAEQFLKEAAQQKGTKLRKLGVLDSRRLERVRHWEEPMSIVKKRMRRDFDD